MLMRSTRYMLMSFAFLCVAACGGGGSGGGGGNNNPSPQPMFEGMQVVQFPMAVTVPANADSPYAGVLRDCVFSNTRSQPCTLGTLPLLGTETRDPTIDDVMDRVLVSHAWMGPRIRDILEELPDDVLLLFRGVTAMVISRDVRPSFYWTATGAIYIDPDYIWLTPAERVQGVSTRPDFRSDFGADLQFNMPWRYVLGNAPAYFRPPFGAETPRTIDDLIIDIGRLLYHELAHANDYFPNERQANLSPTQRPQAAIIQPIVSDDLTTQLPLQSAIMRGLARVRFHGDSSTAAQRAMTPSTVAGHFAADRAVMFYGYSTQREDLAMLFEILMMHFHFGVEADHAVTNNPANPTSGHDFIVAWGQRNRIAEPSVLERARYAVSRLLPEVDIDAFIATIPPPRMMRPGESWLDNLFLDPSPALPQGMTASPPRHFHLHELPVEDLPGYH